MAVILNMFGFDNTMKVNCQVSPVSHVWLCLVNCDPQGHVYYERRKHLVLCDQRERPIIILT
jgi:hypothetical protein